MVDPPKDWLFISVEWPSGLCKNKHFKLLFFNLPIVSIHYINAPVNVMLQGGEDGQTVGILTQNKYCIRIPNMGHVWMSEYPPPTFPRIHVYFYHKTQCQNSLGSITPCQNSLGWRHVFHQNAQGYLSSPPWSVTLTGALMLAPWSNCHFKQVIHITVTEPKTC